jgi:hypothetical protein
MPLYERQGMRHQTSTRTGYPCLREGLPFQNFEMQNSLVLE